MLLANSIVPASIVVSGIFFACDKLIGVEQLTISPRTNLVWKENTIEVDRFSCLLELASINKNRRVRGSFHHFLPWVTGSKTLYICNLRFRRLQSYLHSCFVDVSSNALLPGNLAKQIITEMGYKQLSQVLHIFKKPLPVVQPSQHNCIIYRLKQLCNASWRPSATQSLLIFFTTAPVSWL